MWKGGLQKMWTLKKGKFTLCSTIVDVKEEIFANTTITLIRNILSHMAVFSYFCNFNSLLNFLKKQFSRKQIFHKIDIIAILFLTKK